MFTVFDGAGFSIEGAKVVVKNLGGTIVASGLTNTAGQIDLSSLSAGSYKLLVYKSGAFKGARIDYCGAGSPASIKLVKVAQVNMSFTVYKHDTNAFVSGATVVCEGQSGPDRMVGDHRPIWPGFESCHSKLVCWVDYFGVGCWNGRCDYSSG
jgi:hypothetical protein